MKTAFLIYPGFTTLDAVGPFEVLSRLPDADVQFVSKTTGPVPNDNGFLSVQATCSLQDLTDPDILVVPGGSEGTRLAAQDPEIQEWVNAAHAGTTWTTSVCTGSLILGAAGILKGLDATTHWSACSELEQCGASYQATRWVQEGKIITAAGVSAGIDMGLFLAGELVNPRTAQALQLILEYDPQPPWDSGSVATASPEVLRIAQTGLEAYQQETSVGE